MENRPELLNVNIPAGEITENTPVTVVTKGVAEQNVGTEIRDNPQRPGQQYFWVLFKGYAAIEEGTDFHVLGQGAISVMPIKVDPVDYDVVEDLRKALAQ
jgi:broad specificity polyphosphatase/5'/3'-nucleotidase SurE